MSAFERLGASAAGIALAAVFLGVPVLLMTLPAYTSALVLRVDAPALNGLDVAEVRDLAEQVRAYVSGAPDVHLPATLADGAPGFDEHAIAHLEDVRDVLTTARWATVLAAAATIAWVAWTISNRRMRAVARSLATGAWLVAGVVVLSGIAGFLDFGRLFSGFHGLFFAPGTWEFPADALLIRLFPEAFWVISAAVWGGLSLAMAVLAGVASRVVRTRARSMRE